jgi:hypothetical protein
MVFGQEGFDIGRTRGDRNETHELGTLPAPRQHLFEAGVVFREGPKMNGPPLDPGGNGFSG